jgi:hypothetical protein
MNESFPEERFAEELRTPSRQEAFADYDEIDTGLKMVQSLVQHRLSALDAQSSPRESAPA